MKVFEVMTKNVVTLKKDASVLEAMKLMKEKDIGIVVIEDDNEAIGVITDRDIIILLAREISTNTNITKVMKKYVITINGEEPIDRASDMMGYMQVRRLIVVNDTNKIIGILSITDLLRYPLLEEYALEALLEISYNYSTPNTNFDKELQTNAYIL